MSIKTPNADILKSAARNIPFKLLIFILAGTSLGSLAMNYTDNRPTVGYTQVCFNPPEKVRNKKVKYCTSSQRYWIADPILREWSIKEPEFYNKLKRLKFRNPEAQDKWIYGLISLTSGLSVLGLGAARLSLINKHAPGFRKEMQAIWHRDAVRNGVQMASDAIDGKTAIKKKSEKSEVEFGRYQAALLTDEEIAGIQQQQAFLDAEYHASAGWQK